MRSVGLYALVNMLYGLLVGWVAIGVNGTFTKLWPCLYSLSESETLESWILKALKATILGGATIGAILSWLFLSKLSKRGTIALGSIVTTVGCLGSCFSWFYQLQFVSRALSGIGIGILGVACPYYVALSSPDALRGTLSAFLPTFATLGAFLALLEGYWLLGESRDYTNSYFCMRIPEDLVRDHNLAINFTGSSFSLALLLISKFFITDQIQDVGSRRRPKVQKPKQAVQPRPFGAQCKALPARPTVVGLALVAALHLSGTFVVLHEALRLVAEMSTKLLLITGGAAVPSLIVLILVDKIGRRNLLVPGMFLLSVSMLILGSLSATTLDQAKKDVASFVCVVLFIVGWQTGPATLIWVINGEIFTEKCMALGMSLITAIGWALQTGTMVTYYLLNDLLSTNTCFIFGAISLALSVFILFCFPETKGKRWEVARDVSVSPLIIWKPKLPKLPKLPARSKPFPEDDVVESGPVVPQVGMGLPQVGMGLPRVGQDLQKSM